MISVSLALGLALTAVACGDDGSDGNTGDPDAAENPPDAPSEEGITLTEVVGTFAGPESAHWDAANNVWYVANFGQDLDLTGMTPDQPAYITRVAADGTVMDERWVEVPTGDLLGMATMDGTLYVSHGTDLLEVNTATAEVNTVAVPGAAFLNDVAAGGGTVYISDTGTSTIHRYTPGGMPEVFSNDPALIAPNGLLVDGEQLIVGTLGSFPPDPGSPGAIFAVNAGGEARQIGSLTGAFDGVEKSGDQYLISDFNGPIYLVSADGTSETIANFTDAEYGLSSTADIGLDPATGTVMIPDLVGNQVHWFTLP